MLLRPLRIARDGSRAVLVLAAWLAPVASGATVAPANNPDPGVLILITAGSIALASAAVAFAAITVRKRAQRTPARPSAWSEAGPIAATIEALDAPTVVASPSGIISLGNSSAESALSPKRPIVGRRLDEIFTKVEILDLIASARRGVARRADVRVPTAEGLTVLQVLAAPLPAESAPPEPIDDDHAKSTLATSAAARSAVVVSVRDVTELALALQLKTDFVANASHELRTPIAAIRAAVDTLSVAGDDVAMRERLLGMVDRHTLHLDELVRDLLDLSKLESPDAPLRIRDIDALEVLTDIGQGLATQCASKRVELRFDLPERFSHLRTDGRMLTLILKNLMENAIKFADEGTTVLVEGEVRAPVAEEGQRDYLPGARFRVIDRGVGIPLHQQQRIFERFFQADESRSGEAAARGTGLGLAIVKHGVRALNGTVSVDSVWQKGTTMTVDLPAVIPAQDPGAISPEAENGTFAASEGEHPTAADGSEPASRPEGQAAP